jgi:ParB/RepB/Spo0J family partition protein
MTDVIDEIDPFDCRMWDYHDRLEGYLTDQSCREMIESFRRVGQKHPVLARCGRESGGARYELIYGARRLFAARYLNIKLLAKIKDLDDRQALIEMDVENRLRRDISPYERGMSFKAWLRSGHFRSQEEIAKTLGLSTAHVSRLMRFAELPTAVIIAFPDPRHIREAWAVGLAERCADSDARQRVLSVARSLATQRNQVVDAKNIYKRLIDGVTVRGRRVARIDAKDDVVRGDDGRPLFRVSYRHNDLHVIIRRDIASTATIDAVTDILKRVLQRVPERGGNGVGLPSTSSRPGSGVQPTELSL